MDKANRLLTSVVILLVAGFGYLVYQGTAKAPASLGSNAAAVVDLIGTHVGATTTGVAFTSSTTPVSYRRFVGSGVDEATLFVVNTAANASNIYVTLYGSNDPQCDIATTTGTINSTNINWFELAPTVLNLAGATSVAAATSTVTLAPANVKLGKTITYTNLNSNCLKFDVTASTTVYAQLRFKQTR